MASIPAASAPSSSTALPSTPTPANLSAPTPTFPTPTFPISAFGPLFSAAVAAAAARSQAAPELVAHHLLTLAAMAAQRLIAVRLPTGVVQPVSVYLLTLAASGEGRSAAEEVCLGPVRGWQQRFLKGAHQGDDVFRRTGTPVGMRRINRYATLRTRGGLFAPVAADLLSAGLPRRAEAESLSALWDGALNARVAAAAPRLSVHLVTSPGEGLALLRAPEALESGLSSRILALRPASRIGARDFREGDRAPPSALQALHERLTELYDGPATSHTHIVTLDDDARRLWRAFAQEAEIARGPGGAYAAIRPLAGRLAEHAARLAAVVALVEDEARAALTALTAPQLARGIDLARFYAEEALRLSDLRVPRAGEDGLLAALQSWLVRGYAGQEVSLREIYSRGPVDLRSAAVALRAMRQLELLGAAEPVKPAPGPAKAAAWRVPLTAEPVAPAGLAARQPRDYAAV